MKSKSESSLFTDSSAGFYLPTYRFVPGNGTKLPWQRAISCHNQAVNGIRQRMPIFHSVLDIIGVLNEQDDYSKNRNYWKYLKTKLKKENNELVSATNQLKLQAPDGKLRLTDVLDNEGIMLLARNFPNNKAADFLDWSLIDKNDYLAAMTQSVVDSSRIKQLISNALTDKIEDREIFMKGIDYSYYYEQVDE